MNCLDFRRQILSDPQLVDADLKQHNDDCIECAKYFQSVKQMDVDLEQSLQVEVPEDLTARLKLAHELGEQTKRRNNVMRFALAASVACILFVGAYLFNSGLNSTVKQDYQSLVAGVAEHMHEVQSTPVWSSSEANQTAQTLLASYDSRIRLKTSPNLRFSKICPMGNYKGLHATMETTDGMVTFAYIKGEPVKELVNVAHDGHMARVKPLKHGNLIIISQTNQALDQADDELDKAIYWDI